MHRYALVALICLLTTYATPAAETPKQLATRHLCFACHTTAEFRVGPSFQDVAERYSKRKDAVAYLLKEMKDGSVGKWGTTPMPPENVPDAELKLILQWVMQQ